MSSLPILELRAVGKSYGANRVLKGIDLTVTRGEIVSLIGPSGSGKTTALRCMNFLEAYDEGEVWIKGQLLGYRSAGRSARDRDSEKSIAEVRRPVSMVFQQFNLWPHMSVLGNVAAPLVLSKKDGQGRCSRTGAGRAEARRAGRKGGCISRVPERRSAATRGHCTRVAIEPEVMLLDEPTSAPRSRTRGRSIERDPFARAGWHDDGHGHSRDEFRREDLYQVVFMEAGQIVEAGPPAQLFGNTRTPRLQQFLEAVVRSQPVANYAGPTGSRVMTSLTLPACMARTDFLDASNNDALKPGDA